MLLLLAVLYVVKVVGLPTGMTVNLTSSVGPPVLRDYGWSPGKGPTELRTTSLSPFGSVAVLLQPSGPRWAAATKLLVIRADGSQVMLPRPDDQTLAEAFHESETAGWKPSYPYAYFDGVSLARDGTPFATVAATFSGAFSGVNTAVFTWNGEKWTNVLPQSEYFKSRNITIGAADILGRAAFNVNTYNQFVNLDEAERDPHYHEFWTFLADGRRQTRLGYGSATAMRGDVVVGYSAGISQMAKNPQPCIAWEWLGDKRVNLGRGIAYGINASHDAVGDDEQILGTEGRPVLWRNGSVIRLSDEKGSALAISDDGTIAGYVGDDGFLIRGDDSRRRIVRIDTVLAQRGWHVFVVYAIASTGRLLAVGNRSNEKPLLLLLDPVR